MSPSEPDARTDAADPPIADLSYEEAKEQLVAIVATLESGSASLEESMRLWERGEQLAAHCTQWLDNAQAAVAGSGDAGADDEAGD